jgi:hypothetical protein
MGAGGGRVDDEAAIHLNTDLIYHEGHEGHEEEGKGDYFFGAIRKALRVLCALCGSIYSFFAPARLCVSLFWPG